MVRGVETKPRRSLKRTLRLEKDPLPAGDRERVRRPVTLRTALVVLGILLLLAALVVGAVKAWGPTEAHAAHWYDSSREALFPEFDPVAPSSVNPSRRSKLSNPAHPPADAFDSNLSTYWQSTTARDAPDKIRVNFKQAANEIDEVAIFAGDPTGTTIVPKSIQMTFFRWQPRQRRYPGSCKPNKWGNLIGPRVPEGQTAHGVFCVIDIKRFDLVNTPTEQRFSTGKQTDVGQITITIRGVHRADNPKAKAAMTDVEFFTKH
jgi:hypothetical protein